MRYIFYGKELTPIQGSPDLLALKKQLIIDNFPAQFEPFFVNQIHSNRVVVVDEIEKIALGKQVPEADAIVTNVKNLIIGVVTADCVPIILHDEVSNIIAAIHAGWRGARHNIIANAVSAMINFGSESGNIKAIIGPAIRQQSYEVSKEFYDDFLAEKLTNQKFFIPSIKSDFWMFDLVAYVKEKLAMQGVSKILDQEIDTYSNPEKFFSYRRAFHLAKKELGRNFSLCFLS